MVGLSPGYHAQLGASADALLDAIPALAPQTVGGEWGAAAGPLRLLDLGCGSGASTRALVESVRRHATPGPRTTARPAAVLAVDGSAGMLDAARSKARPSWVGFAPEPRRGARRPARARRRPGCRWPRRRARGLPRAQRARPRRRDRCHPRGGSPGGCARRARVLRARPAGVDGPLDRDLLGHHRPARLADVATHAALPLPLAQCARHGLHRPARGPAAPSRSRRRDDPARHWWQHGASCTPSSVADRPTDEPAPRTSRPAKPAQPAACRAPGARSVDPGARPPGRASPAAPDRSARPRLKAGGRRRWWDRRTGRCHEAFRAWGVGRARRARVDARRTGAVVARLGRARRDALDEPRLPRLLPAVLQPPRPAAPHRSALERLVAVPGR